MTIVEQDAQKTEALVGRLFNAALESVDVLTVFIGDTLGLYRSLRTDGPATSTELAQRCGIAERYAREWLEQQAVTGIIEVDDAAADPQSRRYTLSPEHGEALTDPDSPFSIAPLAKAFAAVAQTLPQIVGAFKTGGGVPWENFGPDMIESQGDFNRPWLRTALGAEYLPSVPDVHERLTAGARVADVACGVGWAGISIAQSYPEVRVDGFDLDDSSIAIARRLAAENGVSDRVSFEVRDCADPALAGSYDLVIVIEAIHDLSRPVEVLAAIRRMLAPGGTAIVADERVGETFAAPGDEMERLMYGFSLLCCLPAGMAEQPSAGTGTVMRPATFRAYAAEAGFADVQVLDQIEHPMLRFYRLVP